MLRIFHDSLKPPISFFLPSITSWSRFYINSCMMHCVKHRISSGKISVRRWWEAGRSFQFAKRDVCLWPTFISGSFFCSFIFVGRQYCNTVADVFSETDTITKKKSWLFGLNVTLPLEERRRRERSIPISIFPKVELESRGIRTKFLHQTHTSFFVLLGLEIRYQLTL